MLELNRGLKDIFASSIIIIQGGIVINKPFKLASLKIGWRTIKTVVTVAITVLIFELTGRGSAQLATLAAIFALQSDFDTSFKFGRNRLFGNTIGVIVALLMIRIGMIGWIPDSMNQALVTSLGVLLIILICNFTNMSSSIFSSSAAFLVVLLGSHGSSLFVYGVNRVLDTMIGSIIALIVNSLLPNKPKTSPQENL